MTTDVANFRGTADRVSDGSTGTSYRVSNPNGAILRAPTNATVTGVALSSGDLPSNTLPLTIIELDFGDGWTGRLSNFGGVISVASGDELSAGDSMGTLSAGDSVRFDLKYQSYDGSPTTVPVDPFLAPYKFFAEPQVTTPGDGGGGVSNALDSVNQTYVFNPHEFATSPANKSQDCLIEDVHQDAGWMSVQLHSGEYAETVTDLEIPGRGFNWKFERTYRSGANFETALGQSWDFADNRRIVEAGADNTDRLRLTYASIEAGDVVRLDGKGRMDLYELQADGTFRSPGEFYTRLEKLADGTFRERDEQGSVAVYDAVNSVGVGRVLSLSDRNDNSLRYEYDEHGRLDRVLDTMGRVIRYAYADDGLITHIEDFAGRQVRFEYDANRDLVAVTSPVVEGTSTWNDFLDGRTTRYVYSSGNSNERLNHNLLQIIRPNEVAVGALDGNFTPTITLTYGADDRVDSQTVGGTNANGVEAGGTITYDYSTTNAPRPNDATVVFHTLEVNDRAGNLTRYEFNTLGNILRIEEFTNRDVRPGDDESFITKFEYNTDGELLRKINPEGDFITTAFASTDDRFQAGNAVRTEHHRGQRSGDQDVLITERGFEPIYNQVRSVTDARAFDPEHEAPIVVDGLDNADRYTTEWFYDYQESDQQFLDALLSGAAEFSTLLTVDQSVLTTEVLLVRELGLSEDAIGLQTLRDRLSEAGVQLGLGDLNADGTTDAVVAGNVVRIEYPDVHLLVGSNQAAVEGDRTQEIVELFRYNRFGQLTSQVDQEGNLTTYEYYAEQNPNSLNDGVDNADGAADTGGYLRRVVVDANPNESRDVLDPAGANGDGPDPSAQPLDPTRNSGSGAASTHIQGHFEYDSVGNVIRSVDGRGVVTEFEVNALNEVVVVTTAADHGFYAPGVFDAEEPLELENFAYQRRLFRDYNGNVVLEQAEDRGNTSHTDGNVPTADLSRHFFLERSRSTGNNALRLLGDDNQDWEINQWNGLLVRIEDGTGAGQVRTIVGNTSNMLFLDERWDDVPDETSVYVILPNPDAEGGTAYADTAFEYDILDNRIETVREVNHDANHYVRTSDRYDRNENRVLTILPEGNAISSIYDERDLLFQTSRGVVEAPDSALMAADDPVSFDVRGGELCQCSTFYVDGNRNVIAIVDSDDTDRDASNNMRISATQSSRVGDAVRLNYDGFDRLIFTTDAMGNQTRNTYDAAGNVTRVIRDGDPVNDNNSTSDNVTLAVTEFVHDELNRTVVQQQVLFETPDVITQRDVELTDTEAMDQFLSQSLVDDLLDAATVPGAIGLQNGRILGRVSHLTEYDRKSRVTFTVEDDLVTNRREYDGADRVIKTTDSALANGFSLTPATEDSPAVAAFDPTQLAGNTVERAYDDNNNVVEHLETDVTDVLLSSGPEQFRTTYYYDSLNRLQTRVNNIGQAMDHRYDSRNNRVATADAQGPTVLFGKPRAVHRRGLRSTDRIDDVNYFGNVTLYTYDGLNRQTMTEQLLTRRGFGDGFNIGATLEGVRSHRPNVDASQGGGDGIIRTATTYDDNSNVSARIDDNGNVSLRLYDNLDRKITETEGLNVRSQLSEDLILGDRVVPVNTAATISNTSTGISEAKIEAQLAEAASRLDVIEPLFVRPADRVDDQPPTTVVYGYTPDSNVQYIEDENDTEIFTQYDANNRAVAVRVYRAGQLDRHNDDPVFDPNPSSDFANHTDPDNPPVVIGTTRQNFTYDGLNRRTSATDNNNPGSVADDSRLTSAYDSLSRVVEQTQQTGTRDVRVITSDWNANDRRSGLTYSNGRELSFAYDTLDRLKAISDVPGPDDPPRIAVPLVHYDYIGTDRVLERAHQNGTQTSMLGPIGIVPGRDDVGYDGLRRVVQMRQVSGHNFDFAGTTRTYDRENNVTSEGKTHDVDNSETYRYDSAYRLTGLDRGLPDGADPSASEGDTRQPQDSRWTLDGAGNWQSVDGETRQHTSFNEVATRTSGGTTTALAYDDNGNLLEDGEHSYEYDFRNRLVRVTDAGGNEVARYAYDANNRRSLSVVSNSGELDGTTEFIYDGARAIEERNGDQTLRNQYVYGNRIDEVVVLDRNLDADDSAVGLNDQRLFYHSNPLGSVIALTNASGNVVEGYDYDAYGRVTVFTAGENGVVDFGGDDVIAVDGVSELDNPYLFTGRRLDAETGLYYYRNRYFDAGLGRFIQRDPIGTWGDPLALGNAYVYAAGRPVTATDPLGLFLSLEYNMLLGGSFLLATSGSTSCDGNGSIINASYDVSSAIGALSQHYVLDLAAVGPPIANAADSNYPGVTGLHGCGPGGSCGVPVTRVYTDYSRTSIGVVDQSYTYSPMGASEQGRELSDVEVVCHYELHWILFFPYRIWICEEFEIPEERPLEIPYNPGPPPAGHAGDEKYPQVNDVHVVPPVSSLLVLELLL
ncbi:MAG: DUF6531 domain-containing protein [Planctomycetota bacterium]|nr:DUF6531 domain-containing protein [Planctomycetota bacterium]